MWPSVQQPISRQKCYDPGKKILLKKQLFDLEVKVPRRSLRYATHHFMVMHPHTKYHWPISKDKNVMARRRKYYLKNNYLTLRSKVKVPRRSLRYVTHRLMVMHPHTKYILFKKQISLTYLERQKKLWSGQASLRRSGSGRKNQTTTICLPLFEGET